MSETNIVGTKIPLALVEQVRWNITPGESKKPFSIAVNPISEKHGEHPLSGFEEALKVATAKKGCVMFKFGATVEQMGGKPLGNLLCIDLDGCLDEAGRVVERYQPIIDRLLPVAWCEWSPSGRGLHFLLRTNLGVGRRSSSVAKNKNVVDDGQLHYDLFFEGHGAYGVRMTGNEYPGCQAGDLGCADDVVVELLEGIHGAKSAKPQEPSDKQVRLVAAKFNERFGVEEVAREHGAIEIVAGKWHHGHAGSNDLRQPNMSVRDGVIWLFSSKHPAVAIETPYTAFGYACAMSGKSEQEFAVEVAGRLGLTLGGEGEELSAKKITNAVVIGILEEHLDVEEEAHGLKLEMFWDGQDKIRGRAINRHNVEASLQDVLHYMTDGNPPNGKCSKAVSTMLESPTKSNRFRDALDKLEPVSGTDEIEKFVRCVAGAKDVEWLLEYWKIWFTALVAYQYDASHRSCQVTPILCASQGMGKSTVPVKILEPFGFHPSTFIGLPDPSNKDNIPLLLAAPLVELSEIVGNNKTEISVVKAFLTSRSVKWRRPYASKESEALKATLYIGTTNEYQIFSDKTGNRRFFVMDLDGAYSEHADVHARKAGFQAAVNAVDFRRVIAEAKFLFESGFKWYTEPSAQAVRMNEESSKAFTMESSQDAKVMAHRKELSGRALTTQEIYGICDINMPANSKNPQFAEFLKSSGLLEKPPYMSNGVRKFKFRDLANELDVEAQETVEDKGRVAGEIRTKKKASLLDA